MADTNMPNLKLDAETIERMQEQQLRALAVKEAFALTRRTRDLNEDATSLLRIASFINDGIVVDPPAKLVRRVAL